MRKRKRTTTHKRTFPTLTPRDVLTSRAFTIIVLFAIILLAVSLTKSIIRKVEINKQIADLEVEIASLEQENVELDNVMQYFNSSEYQEKEARTKLGLQQEGESVVIIPNDLPERTATTSTDEAMAAAEVPNSTKWKQYFFQ